MSSMILSKKVLVKRHLNCPDSVYNSTVILILKKTYVFKCLQKPSLTRLVIISLLLPENQGLLNVVPAA